MTSRETVTRLDREMQAAANLAGIRDIAIELCARAQTGEYGETPFDAAFAFMLAAAWISFTAEVDPEAMIKIFRETIKANREARGC